MTYNILQIETSIRDHQNSYSTRNADFASQQLLKKFPSSKVVSWDLAAQPIPYLTADWDTAAHTPAALRSEEQNQMLQQVNMQLLADNDIYVIALAGYVYDAPAVFKSFLEHMVVFDLTVNPDWSPLLKDKKVIVITAWGGDDDSIEPEIGYEYILKKAFAALGIHEIKFFNIYRTDDISATEDNVQAEIAKYVAEIN